MKNTLIVIVVIVLIVLGFMFLGGGDKAQAPVTGDNETVTPSPTPTPSGVNVQVDGSVGTYQSPVKEFTVKGTNFAFDPKTITVNKGDKVKITFINSQGFHDFRVDEFGAATKQFNAPGTEVIEFTADKAGSFEYYCSVGSHRAMGMKGTLVVK